MAEDGVSPMDARIDLTAPRIKEGGVAIWYGRTVYRNCHVQATSADGQTVTLSTSTGIIQVEWLKVPADAKTKLFAEYSREVARANNVVVKASPEHKKDATGSKSLPGPSPDKNWSEEKALRDLYRRRIEALRRERDAVDVSAAYDHTSLGAQWRKARKGTIQFEIDEIEAKIRALNGPAYKLRSIVIKPPTDK
jgi:hypothetical protein